MVDKNIDIKKLRKIRSVLYCFKLNGISVICREDLKTYLSEEEINYVFELYYELMNDSAKLKEEKKQVVTYAYNIINETPYTILGLTEGEYSKEELLAAVENKIYKINSLNITDEIKSDKINKVLDAYNLLISNRGMKL